MPVTPVPVRPPTVGDYGKLFLAAAIWGSSFLCNAIALEDFAPVAIAGYRVAVASMVILVVCRLRGLCLPLDHRSVGLFVAIGFLALGPTAFAYTLRTGIVQRNGAVFMSGVGYLIPPFAMLWAWLFLDETPNGTVWLALVLIVAGLLIGRRASVTDGFARYARDSSVTGTDP